MHDLLLRGLRGACAGKRLDEAFCEDIAQEATLRIIDRLDQFERRSQFTTWAMTIAVRQAVNEFRRTSFGNVSSSGLNGDNSLRIDVAAEGESPDHRLWRGQVMRQLQERVAALSEKQRVATQALLDGMPVDIIAEKTGSNRNAVYKPVQDVRVRLKQGFERAGYDRADIQSAIGGKRVTPC